MKTLLNSSMLPKNCVLITCASHEERSKGLLDILGDWTPEFTLLLHYADSNTVGDEHRLEMEAKLRAFSPVQPLSFSEEKVIENFDQHKSHLRSVIDQHGKDAVVVDVSVLTKRHLLILLRWLDDCSCWDRLWIVYSEPEAYEIDGNLPLSFGVSSVQQLPGFSSSPNPSRPLHAVMFLGYEGDRAFATYELLQPKRTSVVIPHPPFKSEWQGRTELLNANLLASIGVVSLEHADSVDPESTLNLLEKVLGPSRCRSEFSRAICPLGTKPQTIGCYLYIRKCFDPPAVIYSRALRHNHSYYSRGVGATWLIHNPQ